MSHNILTALHPVIAGIGWDTLGCGPEEIGMHLNWSTANARYLAKRACAQNHADWLLVT